jgi:uncharacterized membrane protein
MTSKATASTPSLPDKLAARLRRLKNLREWHGLIPLAVFLVLTLPTGLYLICNVPAMWAADGGAHTARVFQIADGHNESQFIAHAHGDGYGGQIPLNVIALKNLELGYVDNPPPPPSLKIITARDKAAIAQISSQKIDKGTALISFVNSAAYSPAAYLPIVLGVKLAMARNLNLGHTLMLGRLFGLGTFLLCVGYGLFTLRRSQLKWAVLSVALLPLVVFQASSITADSFLFSVSILFSALMIKGFSAKLKLTLTDKLLLYICVLLLPLIKSAYFLLVFLILLLPRRHWSRQIYYWLWAGTSLVIGMVGFAWWSHATGDVAASAGLLRAPADWTYGDAAVQKHFVETHPLSYLRMLFDTIMYRSTDMANEFFGWLGFTYLPIPGVAQVAGYLALGLSVLVAGAPKFRRYVSAAILAAVALTVIVIITILYIFYSTPMATTAEAVQGRYFLPITILALAALAGCLPKFRVQSSGATTAKVVLLCLMSFCFLFSILRYGAAITT